MQNAVEQEIDRFLHTGAHDTLSATWPGASVVECSRAANAALRDALVTEVLGRTRHATMPGDLEATDLVAVTCAKVSPMVLGLFPTHEQPTILDVLACSVTYLTPRNIEAILKGEVHLSTAWSLANLYLLSCDAEPLSPDARQIIGLSQATTCYVSMQYFRMGDRFDDVIVHEAAHIFHNCKRERIGLKGTRRREWLLEVDFSKRETFAYNAIAPSLSRTPLATSIVGSDTMAEALAEMHPLKRLGTAEDSAALAAFLLSPDAGWITGQMLGVDGGRGSLRVGKR